MSAAVVAIDGPSASGKSSTAAAVARALGLLHVDSGALYRAVTRVALDAGVLDDPVPILQAAEKRGVDLVVGVQGVETRLDGGDAESRIRSADVTAAVSQVSALPAVRDWVNQRLRSLAVPGRVLVLDGRDIGTAVFPDAAVKVYLDAAPAVRAERRLRQRGQGVEPGPLAEETARLAARDQADSSRAVAPLRPAASAVLIDSSALSFGEQVETIVELVRAAGLA